MILEVVQFWWYALLALCSHWHIIQISTARCHISWSKYLTWLSKETRQVSKHSIKLVAEAKAALSCRVCWLNLSSFCSHINVFFGLCFMKVDWVSGITTLVMGCVASGKPLVLAQEHDTWLVVKSFLKDNECNDYIHIHINPQNYYENKDTES